MKIRLSVNFLLIVIVAIAIFLIRLRLLDIPLERDEGEYAYIGQLILKGIPPYKLAYNMKWPGTYFFYALIMGVFGETKEGIHFGYLLVSIASLVLTHQIALRFFQPASAIVAAGTVGLLSLSPGVLGFAAHATQFVMLTTLGGLLLLIDARQSKSMIKIILAGLTLGLGMIMKQHALFFVLFGSLYLILPRDQPLNQRLKHTIFLLIGSAVSISLLFFYLSVTGVFQTFWLWTIQYAMDYEQQVSWTKAIHNFFYGVDYVVKPFFILWLLAPIGLVVLFRDGGSSERKLFILAFMVCSILTVLPGFYFRPHYFVTMIPVTALINAYLIDRTRGLQNKRRIFVYSATLLLLVLCVFLERDYLFFHDTNTISDNIYGHENSFALSKEVATDVKGMTTEKERILVFGSEPQIYFYADRISSTGFLYMYPLKENHSRNVWMQQEMIREIEQHKPAIIVYAKTPGSWGGRGHEALVPLFNWFDQFTSTDYQLVQQYPVRTVETSGTDTGISFQIFKKK